MKETGFWLLLINVFIQLPGTGMEGSTVNVAVNIGAFL